MGNIKGPTVMIVGGMTYIASTFVVGLPCAIIGVLMVIVGFVMVIQGR